MLELLHKKYIPIYLNPKSPCFEFKASYTVSEFNYYPSKSSSFKINNIKKNIPNTESVSDLFHFDSEILNLFFNLDK